MTWLMEDQRALFALTAAVQRIADKLAPAPDARTREGPAATIELSVWPDGAVSVVSHYGDRLDARYPRAPVDRVMRDSLPQLFGEIDELLRQSGSALKVVGS